MDSEAANPAFVSADGENPAPMGAKFRRSIRQTPEGLAALSATSYPVVITDHTRSDNPIVYVNAAFRLLTGYRESEVLGQNCRFLQGVDTDPEAIAELRAAVSVGVGIQREILNYRKNGSPFWNELTIDPIRNEHGALIGYIGLQIECDDTHIANEEKAAAEAALASITDHMPGYIYQRLLRSDGSIEMVYTSPSLRKLLGTDNADQAFNFFEYVHPEDLEGILGAIRKSASEMTIYQDEFRLVSTDAVVHWLRSESIPRLNAGGETVWDGMAIEISAEKRWESEVAALTLRDPLTGLLSRGAWRKALAMRLSEEREDPRGCALLYIDLSGFHQINGTVGVHGGDEVLCAIGQRLSDFAASIEGVSARLGGDEFAVMVNTCNSAEALAGLAQSLATAIAIPIQVGERSIAVQAVIGGTLHQGESGAEVAPGELKFQAEQALRGAKSQGPGSYALYAREHDERFSNATLLARSLESAIANGELYLHYQPLVDIATGAIVSAEALVRWNHPTLGAQRPDIFIPLAEKSGSIVQLGRWVFEEALRQRKIWSDSGLTVPPISINVSGGQLGVDLADTFSQCLAEFGGRARDFELELTESLLIEGSPAVMSCLRDLQDLGFAISIDDFGSGHSTFRYLRDFPVDKLKLDQTYIRKLVLESADAQIIRAVIALARGMGIAFVAEGIETEMQRDFLQREGCKIGQGYLFSRPLAADDFRLMLS